MSYGFEAREDSSRKMKSSIYNTGVSPYPGIAGTDLSPVLSYDKEAQDDAKKNREIPSVLTRDSPYWQGAGPGSWRGNKTLQNEPAWESPGTSGEAEVLLHTKVHRNSLEPQKFGADAIAKGNHIFLSAGAEGLLRHEAGHVLQQRKMKISGDTYVEGQAVSENEAVERHADVLGSSIPDRALWALSANAGEESITSREIPGIVFCGKAKPRKPNRIHRRYLDTRRRARAARLSAPRWDKRTVTKVPLHHEGGMQHRRHIIMSEVMRRAVGRIERQAQSNRAIERRLMLLALRLRGMTGYGRGGVYNARAAAEAIVYILHNNSDNLIAGEGDYNSSIGFMAHHLCTVLQNPVALQEYYDTYMRDRGRFYGLMMQGCLPSCYHEIGQCIAGIFSSDLTLDQEDFNSLLQEVYDSLAVDLMTDVSDALKMRRYLPFHMQFENVQDIGELERVCEDFVEEGVDNGGY